MRILVSHTARIDDLVAYLARCGCNVYVVGQDAIEAEPPQRTPIDRVHMRMELDAYLRVWREMHPGVRADLVQPAES